MDSSGIKFLPIFDFNFYEKKLVEDITTILSGLVANQTPSAIAMGCISCENKNDDETYHTLSESIYKQYYKRKYLYADAQKGLEKTFSFDKFINHQHIFSNGWKVEYNEGENDNGLVLVSKFNFFKKAIPAGNYIKSDTKLSINDKIQEIFVKNSDRTNTSLDRDTSDPNRDLYAHFYGEALPDELSASRSLVRFYFNINPFALNYERDVKVLCEMIFHKLNRRKVPFQLKIHNEVKKNFADAMVMYIERRDLVIVLDALNDIKYFFKTILRDETPMFAYPLYPGIGFAENPINDEFSFGQFTSKIIADIVVKLFNSLGKKLSLIKTDDVLKALKAGGVNTNKFFLNKNSNFEYNYQRLVGLSDYVKPKKIDSFWIDLSVKIGFIICKNAFWDDNGRSNWTSFKYPELAKIEDKIKYKYYSLDTKLTDGLAGIGLYMSELYRISHRPLFKRFALSILYTILSKISNTQRAIANKPLDHGFYSGELGVLWALHKIVQIVGFEDTEIIDLIHDRTREAIKKIDSGFFDKDKNSVNEGLAGTLLGIICLENFGYDNEFDAQMFRLVEAIIKNKKEEVVDLFNQDKVIQQTQIYWEEKTKFNDKPQRLRGIAYGSNGIASVLANYLKRNPFSTQKNDIENIISHITNEDLTTNYSNKIIDKEYNLDWGVDRNNNDNQGSCFADLGFFRWYKQDINTDLITKRVKSIFSSDDISNQIDSVYLGNLELLIEADQLGIIDKIKNDTSDEGQLFLKKYPYIIDFDFKKELQGIQIFNSIIDKIETDTFLTKQITFSISKLDETEVLLESSSIFNPTLLGLSGLGYSFLRIEDPYAVDSYFIPQPFEEFRLKR